MIGILTVLIAFMILVVFGGVAAFLFYMGVAEIKSKNNSKDGLWHLSYSCSKCNHVEREYKSFADLCPNCGESGDDYSRIKRVVRRWTGKEWEYRK